MRANLPPAKPLGLQSRGLSWRKRSNRFVALWVARRDLVDKGYPVATQRIWPPTDSTETVPTYTEWLYISSECERLQNEMLAWCRTSKQTNPILAFNGTLKSLINVYQVDKDSSYHGLRHETRKRYDSVLRILALAVGNAMLSQLIFRNFQPWHEGFRGDVKQNGATIEVGGMVERAHGMMGKLRILFSYGALALSGEGGKDCERLRGVLAKMEFPRGQARTSFVTAAYATAIRHKAHEMGRPSIALAQAIMF